MVAELALAQRDLPAFCGAMNHVGLDIAAITRAAGYGGDPSAVTDLQVVERLWAAAIAQCGDPTLPLAVGDAVPFGTYEVIDYLASSCATVGDGLTLLARYFRLITPDLVWTPEPSADPPRISLAAKHPPMKALVFVQYTLGVTFGRFRRLTDGRLRFARVDFALPEPPSRARHEAFFDCPLAYNCDETVIHFERAMWDLPLTRHEPGLRAVLERHAAALLANEPDRDDPLAQVRAAIRALLPSGAPTLGAIAKAVAMSGRTLQRRLRDADTSFQTLVETERREAAQVFLADPQLAIGEVALMLGYSEPSAFVRAFKRWSGMTPRDFRSVPPDRTFVG